MRAQLEGSLLELLRALQVAQGGRAFGVCRTCRHFPAETPGYRCGLTREPLAAPQVEKLCREYEPAPATVD